ncbi:Os01g0556800 [Oryza sativa Japonica Group]|uniref:Os01g0556800 protein n=1 Tax=Oryza sativa subsp. japonica TaxID=39947 RepID=C7IXF4_ORYSJ|nr:Os01g0556800 [Oryza sativa Japonica Group]|eukprot:NP_001172418.1 Os01g0556800 [Oryza sativa Japonica Group]
MEWEDDGEEAAGSGGQLGGAPLYAVGDEVEVRMDDPGFHGAFYEATVSARLPCSGRYEVMYSTLVEGGGGRGRRGGGPLRETVAACDVRPRPPPPPPPPLAEDGAAPGRELNVFDMVEAYHREGWWPGVVSAAWPARGRKAAAAMYTVSFPSCREEAKLPASLVRRRRAFVRGRWMDARDVVPRVPQYDEGSNVEVMLDTGKHRAAWVTATVIKMVSSKNYVVRLKNKEGSVNIVDYCYIRPQPTFDRKKFEYELEPSAEVEVNLGGAWSLGVISDVGSCGYGVRLKGHDSSEEEDYMLVLRALLRPYCKQDDQELMPCTAKVTKLNKLENKNIKGKARMLVSRKLPNLGCTRSGGKQRHSMKKEFACTSLDLPCISAPKDAVEIKGKSSYVDVVEISDNSGYDAHFNNNAGQLIPLPSYPVLEKLPVKVLPEMNEMKETNHAHLQAEFLAPDDCTAGDQNYALPIKVEVESWVADIRKKEAAMQTITDSGEDNSRRPRSGDSEIPNSSKLEPYSSEQQRFEADLPCMPVPNNVTINTLPLVTRHTFQFVSRNKLEVPVRHKKAPDALEMNTNSVVFSPKEQTHCNLEIFSPNSKKIIDASHYESYASLQQHPLGQCQVPNYWSAAGQSSFVHPSITMNLFTILPAPNSHPTTFASSLLMGPCEKIEDEENVFEEKLRCLSELEEDGFDVRALKERLENLVSIKNHQTELKKKRARLDQFMLEREVDNASVEQSQKLLDIMIKELELKLLEYREKKASLVEKKAANCSEIAKLQGDMDQIEESFLSAEYDFHTTAAAPCPLVVGEK